MEAQLKGNNSHARIGVATIDGYNGTSWLGNSSDNNYALYQASDGAKYVGSSSSSYGASYAVDDIIGVAMDLDNNTVTFYKNGASQGAISFTFALKNICCSSGKGRCANSATPSGTGVLVTLIGNLLLANRMSMI